MKVTRHNTENTIEGYIYEAGFDQKVNLNTSMKSKRKFFIFTTMLPIMALALKTQLVKLWSKSIRSLKKIQKGLKELLKISSPFSLKANPLKLFFIQKLGRLAFR